MRIGGVHRWYIRHVVFPLMTGFCRLCKCLVTSGAVDLNWSPKPLSLLLCLVFLCFVGVSLLASSSIFHNFSLPCSLFRNTVSRRVRVVKQFQEIQGKMSSRRGGRGTTQPQPLDSQPSSPRGSHWSRIGEKRLLLTERFEPSTLFEQFCLPVSSIWKSHNSSSSSFSLLRWREYSYCYYFCLLPNA